MVRFNKIQMVIQSDLPIVTMGSLGGHRVLHKKIDVLCKRWACKSCLQIFMPDENLIRHLKEGRCTAGKTKVFVQKVKSDTS